MKTYFKYFIYIFFLSVGTLHAGEYKFEYITANDGLGDNFVRTLYEDSYGFIWSGTKDGLSRFDGYSVTTYRKKKNDIYSLPSSYVGSIVEDADRNLWIGTGSGIALYERKYDRFEQILFEDVYQNSVSRLVIDSVYLWIATSGGLCRLNTITYKQDWFFTIDSDVNIGHKRSEISEIVKQPNSDILWIGFREENGIVKFNTKTFEYQQFINKTFDNSYQCNVVTSLWVDNDSTLFVGFNNSMPFVFDIKTNEFHKFKVFENTKITCWAIMRDSKQNVWIGTINDGMYMLNPDLSLNTSFKPNEKLNSLNSTSISKIMEDKHGNMWLATHGGGLNVLYYRKSLFNHHTASVGKNSLSHNFVSCFYESSPGKVWIGTDGGGLNYYDIDKSSFETYSIEDGFTSNYILSINKYDNNNLLISTWDGGINIFDINTRKVVDKITYKNNSSSNLSWGNIKYALRNNDSIFVATHGNGLNIFDIKNRKNYYQDKNNKSWSLSKPENGNDLIIDSNNNVWVATTFGLYKYTDTSLTEYFPDTLQAYSISGSYVTDLYIDSKNRLWVGTLEGLNLYNYEMNGFMSSFSHEELNRAIMSIVEDDFGNLWIGSNYGLIRFNPDTDEIAIFDKNDGLQGNQFIERSAYKDSRGNLYFGGVNGFNTFNPKQLCVNTVEPIIYFTDLKILNESQNKVLPQHINFMDELVLKYDQKSIKLDFIALDLLNSSKNQYAYKLEGFDADWYYVHTNNEATYTNLAPGKYVFKVKACNADGVWVEKSKDLKIRILPPWWLSIWFRLVAIIVVVAVIMIIVYYRSKKMRRTNKLLEQKVRKRTAELEESREELKVNNERLIESLRTKDRFFSIIAHDLKNPMNSLIGFSDLLIKRWQYINDEKKYNFINMINSSSNHLLELLTNLLDWSRAQTGRICINYSVFKVKDSVQENFLLLNAQAENKQISLESQIDENLTVYGDVNMVNTILRNLISNSIKYTPKNGLIKVVAQLNLNDYVDISIIDNGVGMSEEKIQTLFRVDKNVSTLGTEKEKGTGLGLLVCQEFITINEGKIVVKSEEGKGTTFIVSLPHRQKNE